MCKLDEAHVSGFQGVVRIVDEFYQFCRIVVELPPDVGGYCEKGGLGFFEPDLRREKIRSRREIPVKRRAHHLRDLTGLSELLHDPVDVKSFIVMRLRYPGWIEGDLPSPAAVRPLRHRVFGGLDFVLFVFRRHRKHPLECK